MFQGTGSSVGKSFVAAALCRILKQDGYDVAPYKSQNMALNSYITEAGDEMGRAQVMQAECAGIKPDVRMNPVLLKPNTDNGSQIIVNGKVWKTLKAQEYYSNKDELKTIVKKAYDELKKDYPYIVIEGAGSPAEINLRENDMVNMGLAELVDAPVVLVCDIDKGGVFASLYGTVMLLEPEERERIKGFLINKFRGDVELLWPGIRMIEEKTGVPCLGVIPYTRVNLDDEDSISPAHNKTESKVTIGVIRLKHFSNASDLTVFGMYPDVNVEYYDNLRSLQKASPDLLVIPGSKNSVDDAKVLRESGMDRVILEMARKIPIIGICGGYQILGKKIYDPMGIEGEIKEIDGLGLLDIESTIGGDKRTRLTTGVTADGTELSGYEIHMGETVSGEEPFLTLDDGRVDGAVSGNILGTYLHGIFDNDTFREKLLKRLGYDTQEETYASYKEEQYDQLARVVRENIDLERIYEILGI